VRKLSFTGSTEVGKALIRRSADQVMRLSLELGGHAPAIVFEDADLEEAVTQVMASKFRNAGQTCVCANRIYVQRGIHDRFRAAMAERIAALRVGRGTKAGVQIGPLIDDAAVAKVRRHVEDAIARGAELVVGDDGSNGNGTGHFSTPTLLDGITTDMLIASEETFGPVAGLTVFDTEDEAIALANDTPFGLAAYLLTRDYARMLRVAERLEFGIVGANDGAPSVPSAPFGGVKQSGFGREGGDFGIDEYLNVKYVSIGGVSR
jgi:succinate-semialdehyde dehydrogenase / glutarate-semialdehyde dehydrogenase